MNNRPRIGVLLLNLGTPDSPKVLDVAKYLYEFLSDERVIDIHPIARFLLVGGIIVPFRSPKSAKAYKELWALNQGISPLLKYTAVQAELLQKALGDDYVVEYAMRYQSPSIESAVARLAKQNLDHWIILPLFPQYASASTGSAIAKTLEVISKRWVIPSLRIVSDFFAHPLYIQAFAERGKNWQQYDHILFSYHGLPIRQLDKVYEEGLCADRDCAHEINAENHYCYAAQCHATTRALAEKLGIPKEKYTTVFQSRLGKEPWMEPYAEETIHKLAKTENCNKVLVFSPAFVSDCLETEIEIGMEYKEIFTHENKVLDLVTSLNDSDIFIQCLVDLVKK
jgi:ferrochelatase